MGLLDRIKSGVSSAVNTATNIAGKAVETVKAEVKADVKAVSDTFSATPAAKPSAPPAAAKPPEKHFYDGVVSAFSHTEAAIANKVSSTVKSVETSVTSAAHAVADAGTAVSNAGHQVIDSGKAIIHAGEKAVDDVRHIANDAGRLVSDAGQTAVDAGKAAYHAGNAALTGDPTELKAAHNAIQRARADVSDAHAAVTDAKNAVTDIGTQGTNVSNALHAAEGALVNAKDKLEAAGSSVSGAIHAIASAPATLVRDVAGELEKGGAEAKAAFIRDVPGGRQMLGGLEKYATGVKDIAVGIATGDPFAIAKGIKNEAGGVVDFGKGFVQTPAFDAAKNFVVDYANGFNIEKQVKSLKPGESYELKVGANVHVEVGGEVNGNLKVAANKDGTFTVNAGGNLGVNGYLHAGGRVNLGVVNASAGADGSAHGLVGGNLELKCKNADEAAKAVQIMEKIAANTSAAGLIMNKGQVISKEDAAFLKEHTTSIEVSGTVAADVSAALGLDKGVLQAGIGGSAGLSGKESVKIQLDNGRPTGIDVKQEFTGTVEAHGGLMVGLPKAAAPKSGDAPKLDSSGQVIPDKGANPLGAPKTVLKGQVTDTITLNTHYDFPKGVSVEEFQKDPVAAIKKGAAEMQNSAVMKATITAEAEGTIAGKTGNIAATVSFTGKPSEVFNQTAIDKAMRGDYDAAARAMGDKVTVEGSINTYTQKKWGVAGLGGDILGVGLEGTFQATRRHNNEPMVQFKTNGTEYATQLAANAKAAALKVRPPVVSAR
jgi:hypothetical protein